MTGTHRLATTSRASQRRGRIGGLLVAAGAAVGLLVAASPAQAAPPAITITSSQCPTDMQRGEIDGCVTDLQNRLNSHGAGLAVDGDFGPATFAAVENYQRSHGLGVDGIVGPQTKASLTSTGSTPPPTGTVHAKILSYARAIQAGHAETGWHGGFVQYVWGGGHHAAPGPSTGTCVGDPQSLSCTNPAAVGTDCSGFVRWVYDLAYGRDVLGAGGTGNEIAEMYKTSSPQPGDLVFFGATTSSTHHVGIYIGGGQMINSFETGTNVQTNWVSAGGHLLGYYHL